MLIAEFIVTFGVYMLAMVAFLALAYSIYAIVPFVKSFIRWHFHD